MEIMLAALVLGALGGAATALLVVRRHSGDGPQRGPEPAQETDGAQEAFTRGLIELMSYEPQKGGERNENQD